VPATQMRFPRHGKLKIPVIALGGKKAFAVWLPVTATGEIDHKSFINF